MFNLLRLNNCNWFPVCLNVTSFHRENILEKDLSRLTVFTEMNLWTPTQTNKKFWTT